MVFQEDQSHVFAPTDRIWNIATGSSRLSACTSTFMPNVDKAPLMIPQGNHNSYNTECQFRTFNFKEPL